MTNWGQDGERVAVVLRGLALVPDVDEATIQEETGRIVRASLLGAAAETVGRPIGATKGAQRLQRIAKLSNALAGLMQDLPPDVHSALVHAGMAPEGLRFGPPPRLSSSDGKTHGYAPSRISLLVGLRLLADLAERAVLPIDVVGQLGRPEKIEAGDVAREAVRSYERLTGTPATRRGKDGVEYGPFTEFLAGVFKALRIKASAEAQARTAMTEKTSPEGAI